MNSGIKNLRNCEAQNKPLMVTIASAIENAVAFISRMASCDYTMELASSAASSNKGTRMVTNDFGKWVPAKD